MYNSDIRHHIQQLGVYLCNNIPYTDIEIRKELLQSLAIIVDELGIDFAEYCELLESEYVVKEPINN
jgi:hypothetical protein